METLILEICIAVSLFFVTNIDDVFILLAFFSDKCFTPKDIILGQYLGIFALTFASIALSFGAKQIPQIYIGLLGFIPIVLGLKKLRDLFQTKNEEFNDVISESLFRKSTKILTVVGVTIANGGDNVGVYVPIFATKSVGTLIMYIIVFFLMTGIWCAVALYLVRHKYIGAIIKRFSSYVVPWVFIGLGFYILYQAS